MMDNKKIRAIAWLVEMSLSGDIPEDWRQDMDWQEEMEHHDMQDTWAPGVDWDAIYDE